MIPVCDVQQQYFSLKEEIDAVLQAVAAGGRYILGPQVGRFEQEMVAYCGAEFAVGVGNGTDALYLALRALEIGAGDEVITTPFTFVATAEAISLVGATPVFVDIDPLTFNIDPQLIESAITEKTRAILPVHLFGQPCDMKPILEIAKSYGLYVVEDCAQAVGATYREQQVGTFGNVGCFSFFPSKNLGAMGDAGLVLTNDRRIFERIEMLRRHGGRKKYHHEEIGINSRLDELQAAVLRVKLRHLERWNDLRRHAAYRYNQMLEGRDDLRIPRELSPEGMCVPVGLPSEDNGLLRCVYHQYTLLSENRDALMAQLEDNDIGCLIYYPVPLHLQEIYTALGNSPGSFPNAEFVSQRCLSIPMFPGLTPEQQDRVVQCLTGELDYLARPLAGTEEKEPPMHADEPNATKPQRMIEGKRNDAKALSNK